MNVRPALASAAAVALFAVAGCSGTPAAAPATDPAPTASAVASPTPTATPAPQVAVGDVITGFRTTGEPAYAPAITTSGWRDNGQVAIGSTEPNTLSQWHTKNGEPANILTGMNPAWENLSGLTAGDTAVVTYEQGDVTYTVVDVTKAPMPQGNPAPAVQGVAMDDPTKLHITLFHGTGDAWEQTTFTLSSDA